jgi:probable HAF family extracellular repeat protein
MAFTVTDLTPAGGFSEASAINDNGTVVGQMLGTVAFIWVPNTPNGTTGIDQPLPTFGPLPTGLPPDCDAKGINTPGDVVGSCETIDASGNVVRRGFLFQGGSLVDLGTLVTNPFVPGTFLGNSRALGINDNGLVVGASDDVSNNEHPMFFDTSTSSMVDLGSFVPSTMLPGVSDIGQTNGVNNMNVMVGAASAVDASGSLVQHAFSFGPASSSLQDLGTLLPDPANPGSFLGSSAAHAISFGGTIVGVGDAIPPGLGPLLEVGVLFGSPSLPVGPNPNAAFSVSDTPAGTLVVGRFDTNPLAGPVFHAFVHDQVLGIVDINSQLATPGWTIEEATGVNQVGQICGSGSHVTLGSNRAVLLTP